MSTLSVAMIAKDCESFVTPALETCRRLHADEVVVGIDDTTTDNTSTYILTYPLDCPVTTYTYHFSGFGPAREQLLRACTSEWVLMLDTDEEILESGCASIRRLLPSLSRILYAFPRHNWASKERTAYLDQDIYEEHVKKSREFLSQRYPDHQVRLLPNTPEVNYKDQLVHEVPKGLAVKYFPDLTVHLEHDGHWIVTPEQQDYKNKFYLGLQQEQRTR